MMLKFASGHGNDYNEGDMWNNHLKEEPLNLSRLQRFSFLMVICIMLLSACQPQVAPTSDVQTEPEPPAVVLPTTEPTPEPPSSLVICIGEEPQTLYPYGGNSKGMWSILEAIYDGPIDTVNFMPEPVILEKIPDFESGDARIETVTVAAGERIVDANGSVVVLLAGVRYLPTGCSDTSCAVEWDGQNEVLMDQQSLRYQLKPGLLWSDGQALTANDSFYSFQIASDPASPVNTYYVDRTFSYTAGDDLQTEWKGLPGFTSPHLGDFFWMPMPQHAWGAFSAEELLTAVESTQKPLGWGPYQIDNWVSGSHLELSRNPNYFRAQEGLPKFEKLVFRFLGPNADSNLKALEINECDFVDATVELDQQLTDVVELSNLGEIKAYFAQGPEWEHLDFGIVPSSYDDGYQFDSDRPDWFGDVRMRTAMAYCTDRFAIASRYFVNRSSVPISFYPPSHPAYNPSLNSIPYDVEMGSMLLDQIGWRDDDNNPNTPRISQGVDNVPDGTALVLDYITSQSTLRQLVSADIASSSITCGIEVAVQNVYPTELYAPGPDGVLFGRNFDLAQFTWQAGRTNPCFLYSSNQIPNADNLWVGANITGYANPQYDLACQQAQNAALDDAEAQAEIQHLFNEALPVLPLYYQLKIAASRTDFCGFEAVDVSNRSILYKIEGFGYADFCKN
jgi:peptide/nickel transport system substrate-binding protein